VIEKLKKLGLTGYEAQAYLTLLKLVDAEADEIAGDAKIPMGRIYNVLSSLEEMHLVRSQDTRPRRYIFVEPTTALVRLSKNRQEELKQASVEIETLTSELSLGLSGVIPRKPDRTFWTVAIGDESHQLIRESILGSRKELLFFMASRMRAERLKKELLTNQHIELLHSLYDAIKKGVEVKVILNKGVDFSNIEESQVIKKFLKDLEKGFDCRFATIPTTPFDIIDGESVLLQMLNPLNPEELFAVVNIRDAKLAGELRAKFFTIWENAVAYSVEGENRYESPGISQ
jgi:sugar-specific transcriptional regulator TrmB